MDNGWIKIYRKFSDWEWFKISEMVHIFIFLLVNANHKDNLWRGIEIKRGQILTGLKSLNEKTGISIQTLRTCLKRLEKTQEINIQSTNKYSIITICNYDSYQDEINNSNKQLNKQLTRNQQTTKKQLTTNNNDKNDKNKYNIDLVKNFYDSEIEKSQNNENYVNFVQILFGKNSLSKKLDRVLSMPTQVSFEQFQTIDQYKHNHKVTISDYLVSMENYKDLLKKNTTVQGTLLNWIRRDIKRQQ